MKLWQKISLIAISVLLVIIIICSATLLIYSKNTIVSIATNQGIDKHKNLVSAFGNMTNYYTGDNMNNVTRESVVKYCFSSFADETNVLVIDGKTVYTQLSIDPGKYISPPEAGDDEHYIITNVNGRDLFLQCTTVVNREESYLVYTVIDISDIYSSINKMAWGFALIGAVCLGIGVALITPLVKRGMCPLGALSESARKIAGGEYANRADVITNDEVGALANDLIKWRTRFRRE